LAQAKILARRNIISSLKTIALLCTIAFALLSCTAYQYVASPPYIAQHQKRGELKGNVYPSGIQLGYSATDHLFAFTTLHYRYWPGGRGNPKDHANMARHREYKMSDFNVGAGYFVKPRRLTWEFLAGGGLGTMDYTNTRDDLYNYNFEMKARTRNIYFQTDVGYTFRDQLVFALFAKVNAVRYTHIDTSIELGGYPEPEFADQEFAYNDEVNVVVFSPGFSFYGGWKRWKVMKLHGQGSFNMPLNKNNVRRQVLNVNLGVSFALDRLKQKREK
jgi:hypothetical protein